MSQRLQRITDWQVRAHAANYQVHTLAENCAVSVRTFERHIKREFASCPRVWLARLRMQRAVELLMDAASVKETATELGYEHAQHFSRDFKRFFGCCPTKSALAPPDAIFKAALDTQWRSLV